MRTALVRRAIPGSVVYDPEWAGWVLGRLPSWIGLRGARTDDYQDIDLWRRSAVAGARAFHAVARGPVIVPMAFSRRDYFDEIVAGMRRIDGDVRLYCLRAEMSTILVRLERRGVNLHEGEGEWIVRKARACVDAHEDPHYGEPVDAETRTAAEVARLVLERLGRSATTA